MGGSGPCVGGITPSNNPTKFHFSYIPSTPYESLVYLVKPLDQDQGLEQEYHHPTLPIGCSGHH